MRNNTYAIEIPKKSFNDYSDYRNVYSNLMKNVDEVLNDISKIDVQHIEVKAKNEEVQSKLKDLRNGFAEDVEKLDKNAVWDRFTIAFFGETGAGKSTIIESLRISMQEDEKLKNTALKKSLDLSIFELNVKSEEFITSIIESKQRQTKDLTSQLEPIKERAKILDATFWVIWFNVFRSWFGLLPIIFFAKRIKILEDELFEVDSIIPEQNKTVLELFEEVTQLKEVREGFFDGKIIGTGRQDFTQSCIEYYFNQEEKPFTLIDVPGIEGNERKYETMIMDAVSKAHCVFYVCSTSKLPESGTVAKIKKYLKEQTEVYFLLNERKKPSSFDEVLTFESLYPNTEDFRQQITSQMQNELGEFYKGCFSLQGLMAFFSVGVINPDERKEDYKFQNKLLDRFETREKFYSFSQLEKVETLIKSQLNGMERKIIDANVQKAICATIDFKSDIQEIRNTEYSNDFVQNIEKEIKVAKDKNDNNYRELEKELKQISNRLSNSAVEDLRKKLYDLVDKKEDSDYYQLNISDRTETRLIKDKERKIKFIAECYSKYVFDELSQDYKNSTQEKVDKFTKDVKENINKMVSNIKQISIARFSSDFDNNAIVGFDILFSFDFIKLGSWANTVGGMAITGALLGSEFPVIGNIIGAVIGTVVGLLFVGIRWLIDKESPESKAKKQIDEKLSSLKTEIKTKLDDSNTSIIDNYKEHIITTIKIMLDYNITGIKAIQAILDTKTNQLEILIEEVKNSKN